MHTGFAFTRTTGAWGRWARLSAGLAMLLASATTCFALSPEARTRIQNAGSVGIITGGADGTYIRVAADLANVLDDDTLRVLPIIGKGSLQNLRDLLTLRGVDVGIVQMDARQALQAENLQAQAAQKLRYIARLYNEEVHIVASRDITDIHQLDGRKVNIDVGGSGTSITARILFEKLGIKPNFTTLDQAAAFAQLAAGEIQATVYVAGRPVRIISDFRDDGRFHLLSIPFEGGLEDSYFPAQLTAADYPRLVGKDEPVETIAVGNILACFNWPKHSERHQRLKRFVDALFQNSGKFLMPGRHPKWKEINLQASVPGWERFAPAEEWARQGEQVARADGEAAEFTTFMNRRFGLAQSLSQEERVRLFQQYTAWRRENAVKRAGEVR